MTPSKTNKPKNITFIDGLQLLFIALKLTHYIDWAWFLVLLPHIVKFTLRISIHMIEERNRNKRG